MSRVRRLIILAGVLAALSGCGSDTPTTPSACLGSASSYLKALGAAPGEVRLAGTTPISDCLVKDQASGALQTVGKSVIDTATELNRRVRGGAGEEATVELGYLVGAVQQGAGETAGIHTDLIRRLDAAARFVPRGEPAFDAAFERAFGRGYAAGQAGG